MSQARKKLYSKSMHKVLLLTIFFIIISVQYYSFVTFELLYVYKDGFRSYYYFTAQNVRIRKEDSMAILNIYTDGACSGNQNEKNAGGWGAILEWGETRKELHGGEADTTNNKMEMTALIEALSCLKRTGLTINVFSDSTYLMDCFRKKWYVKWQKNGWVNSAKEPVKNRELWERLLTLVSQHDISFYIVKGHVDVSNKNADLQGRYKKFKSNNGPSFTYDDFLYITKMNNRADELANIGMAPYKK